MKIAIKSLIGVTLVLACTGFHPEIVFAQDAAEQKQTLVDGLHDYTIGSLYTPLILKKLIAFDMSPQWWSRINNSDQKGLHSLSFATRDLNEFGKRMGWGDAAQWESSGNGTKEEWKPRIENLLDQWKEKFTLTLKPDSPKCDSMNYDLAMRYFTSLSAFLATSDWKPSSGIAHITLIPSSTAKDISVAISKDGKTFTVFAPDEVEPSEWDTKMANGFKKAGTNRL